MNAQSSQSIPRAECVYVRTLVTDDHPAELSVNSDVDSNYYFNYNDDGTSTHDDDGMSGIGNDNGNGNEDASPVDTANSAAAKPNNETTFYYECTFTNVEEYNAYMKQEHFSIRKSTTTGLVENRYMRCNLVKKVGPQCAARLAVRLSKEVKTWVVESNRLAHTHEIINNKTAIEIRKKIGLLRQQRIPPKKTFALVKAEFGQDAPDMTQIYNLNRSVDAQSKTSLR